MERLRLLGSGTGGLGGSGGAPPPSDGPAIDNAETVYISSLALLKMLKHGRAGVPMEVMGLMLGEFVDDFTIHVIDVFAMPQSGTGVSVEAVDDVFQTKMMDMLRQTGRDQMVVGWYHSHPGFGCWLSSVDVNTQQSFEQLNKRSVAVVIDPIQSVKGKVVIDAFRTIDTTTLMMGQEPRQSTSNVGHLNKPSIQALIHGLNRHYYSLNIDYHKTVNETNMLLNLHKQDWQSGLKMQDYEHKEHENLNKVEGMVKIAKLYNERIVEEKEFEEEVAAAAVAAKEASEAKAIEAALSEASDGGATATGGEDSTKSASSALPSEGSDKTNDRGDKSSAEGTSKASSSKDKETKSGPTVEEQLKTRYVGKQDPKKHLSDTAEKAIEDNILSLLTGNVNSLAIH